ncbi:MAG TPA: glycosyl hydrolase, partial [Cyclobacteriaceae bacterium]|nr:glycosyl hydrolase [Cyclobacteriaceae bacterium]
MRLTLKNRRSSPIIFIGIIFFSLFNICRSQTTDVGTWPAITREAKPWTRWWWHGNALTKEGITAEMEAYKKVGIGGLEITPIYGVFGYEDKFIDFLSPAWMELLIHTLKEGERLDMGIDMATGTGWPFGGPWINDRDACKNLNYKIYEVKGGTRLAEKIEFIQKPYLKAIGNSVSNESVYLNPADISFKQLVDPIGSIKNLQRLALEQIKFEKRLKLIALIAYSGAGKVLDITSSVSPDGTLRWVAPKGDWKLYALFEGFHGKMVERAGPGGEGNVIDHFSTDALKYYLSHFDSAFHGKDIRSLRSFFNDSYEVDDARGVADWTPTFFKDFTRLRGYNLAEHLPSLFSKTGDGNRVLCDYRETISELLLTNFTHEWKSWAHSKSKIVRNQAHGSPSNILDLYAEVDIPEIEGTEPLRIKMASSAGNVTGKKLISSESATWLNEHFQSNLGDVKVALDRFMLNGVNHMFYHGTSYSPPNEPWPGWLFYAAVHFNPRNPLWNDFEVLNSYVARCQSLLQNSTPDNDVLLYYPIYDRFSQSGRELLEHFDGIKKQFNNTPFERAANTLLRKGYAFDYISDKQIGDVRVENGKLKTSGNSEYKTIVIPHCKYIPLSTIQKIVDLAKSGATILVAEGLPDSISGFKNYRENEITYRKLLESLNGNASRIKKIIQWKFGSGFMLSADSLSDLLAHASVRKESMVNKSLEFIRKKRDGNTLYFIVNTSDRLFEERIVLQSKSASSLVFDPMDGRIGSAKSKAMSDSTEVYIQLAPHQGIFIEMRNVV